MEAKIVLRQVNADRARGITEAVDSEVEDVDLHDTSNSGLLPGTDPLTVVIAISGSISAVESAYSLYTDMTSDDEVIDYANPEEVARSYLAEKVEIDPSNLTQLESENNGADTVYRFAVPGGQVHCIQMSPVQTPPSEFEHETEEEH